MWRAAADANRKDRDGKDKVVHHAKEGFRVTFEARDEEDEDVLVASTSS